MAETTITMEDYIDGLTEDTAPAITDKIITKKAAQAPKKQSSSDLGDKVVLRQYIDGAASVADDIAWVRVPYDMTISKIRLGAAVAPTGATLIGDVHYHATDPTAATTIFTTGPGTERPVIAISGFTDDSGTPDVITLLEGGWISFCIDQVGSTIAGSDLVFEVIKE